MNARAREPERRDPRPTFLEGFLRKPRQVGSIVPSSRFLEKRIVRTAELAGARTVVELGPGTGGTSRALLRALAPDARLLVIEIDPGFVAFLRRTIDDPRLTVHCGDARDLAGILTEHELPAPDVVLSGIPFSTIPRQIGLGIVRAVKQSLAPGGRFVAYQFRDVVEKLGKQVFGKPAVSMELRNVPPMRVYLWRRAPAARPEAG